MKLKTKLIEKAFKRKVIPFILAMGVDTASRTGWCKATTAPDYVDFDYNFIDIKTRDKYCKYNQYINIFSSLLNSEIDIIVIEETYYSKNVKTFQLLSRLGGFVYAAANRAGIKNKRFILATSARKKLGFKGNLKKQIIQKQFLRKLKIKIDDEDIIDAMILAINGILEEKI